MVIFRGKFSIEFEIQFDLSPAKMESSAVQRKRRLRQSLEHQHTSLS